MATPLTADPVVVRWRGGKAATVIPVLIAFGLIFGRWWKTTLAVAVVYWTVVLVATDVMEVSWELPGAAALALANTAVGVLVHQGLLHAFRRLDPGNRTSEAS